jgi:uncharacterized membrane protein HdeD (DUF308 family)
MVLKILLSLLALWIFVYTISYGLWEISKKNKLGAIFVFLFGALELVISFFAIYIS